MLGVCHQSHRDIWTQTLGYLKKPRRWGENRFRRASQCHLHFAFHRLCPHQLTFCSDFNFTPSWAAFFTNLRRRWSVLFNQRLLRLMVDCSLGLHIISNPMTFQKNTISQLDLRDKLWDIVATERQWVWQVISIQSESSSVSVTYLRTFTITLHCKTYFPMSFSP